MMNDKDEFDEELSDTELTDEELLDEVGELDDDDLALDDDDDEDDSAQVRTVLLAKHEMLALLSVRTADDGGRIVRIDPRQPLPAAKSYDDPSDALRWFRRSLATSRDNGWQVIYDGEPLFG
jgi:hypothetical protein